MKHIYILLTFLICLTVASFTVATEYPRPETKKDFQNEYVRINRMYLEALLKAKNLENDNKQKELELSALKHDLLELESEILEMDKELDSCESSLEKYEDREEKRINRKKKKSDNSK